MKKIFTLMLLAATNVVLFAADPECPYPQVEGMKGNAIRDALFEIIKNQKVLSYADIRADKTMIDFDEEGYLMDMYSSCNFGVKSYCGNDDNYKACDCYNREHALPKSYWGGASDVPMYTDLHHILPTDFEANTERGTLPYGVVTGNISWQNDISKVGVSSAFKKNVFEPANEYKGDIARIYFYMLTRYKDYKFASNADARTIFSLIADKTYFTAAAKTMFLNWHRSDPVSKKEIDRNNAIEKLQGNRNPFVDAPDLVEYIWGEKTAVAYSCSTPIENIEQPTKSNVQKVLINGHLYIIYDGKMYNVTGVQVHESH